MRERKKRINGILFYKVEEDEGTIEGVQSSSNFVAIVNST